MNNGFTGGEKFEAGGDGELDHFVWSQTGREFGRMPGAEDSGFKLEIADGGESGGSGDRGAAGIGLWFFWWRRLCGGD